jgi:hypothetical protein
LEKYVKNLAWTAVHSGFEVQIDDSAPLKTHHTGAIYNVPAGDPGEPQLRRLPPYSDQKAVVSVTDQEAKVMC